MHHKYHTEAVILGSSIYGETGKIFFIFTRDFGMLYASAAGIRKLSSKLRYVLQDFSYIRLDLVKGKDFWRITSASKTNELEDIKKHPHTLQVFAHIAKLLRRLIPEQEKNETLFSEVLQGLSILEKVTRKEEAHNIEIIIVLRILSNLGYIGDIFPHLIRSPLEEELLLQMAEYKSDVISEINRALKETQL
jgi:DNA repair protein RecO